MRDIYILNPEGYTGPTTNNFPRARPLELACRSEAIAPAGCPIRSTAFIVDKQNAAFCDGEDRWYTNIDNEVKYVDAGQPFSNLYA